MATIYTLNVLLAGCGDDLRFEIERILDSTGDNPGLSCQALEALADIYAESSRRCRKLAGAASECQDLYVDGDGPRITVEGPPERLEELTRQGLLTSEPFEDDTSEDFLDELVRERKSGLRSLVEEARGCSSDPDLESTEYRGADFDGSSQMRLHDDGVTLTIRSPSGDWVTLNAEGVVCSSSGEKF